jgi:hypothetical protein
MNILKKLEKKIEEAVRKLPLLSGAPREPLEISRDILGEVEGKISSLGGGRRVFPFNLLRIRLHAPDDEWRALYEVAFLNNSTLENAVREHLRPPRCEPPAALEVAVEIIEEPTEGDAAYHITYEAKRDGASAPDGEARGVTKGGAKGKAKGKAQLVVVRGTAAPMKYRLTKKRTNIGRQPEVLDKEGLPLRRNDLVFVEDGGDEVNQTVSRIHAHINHDRETGEFRLHDDNSAYGTLIIRQSGRRVKVTRGLGAPLHSGDEIFFGQARVLFKNE